MQPPCHHFAALTDCTSQVANSLLRHKAPDSTQLALIPLGVPLHSLRNNMLAGILCVAASVPAALLPAGTANDLCTGLEIPTDPRQALEVALSGSDGYPVDLGMVNDQV